MKAGPVLGALLLAGLARAETPAVTAPGPNVAVTNDCLVQEDQLAHGPAYPEDPATRGRQFQEALSVVVDDGAWSGGFTARDVNFYKANASTTLGRPDAALYRVYARYAGDSLSAGAGDFNTLMGRGLILSVVQNDTVLQDWTIRGGQLAWQVDALELRGLAGTVSTNQRLRPNGYQTWDVAGLEASVAWRPGQRVGLRAGTIDDATVPPILRGQAAGRRVTQAADLAGANLLGAVDYYLEAAQVRYLDPMVLPIPFRATDPGRGSGAYGLLAYHSGPWLLQAEFKRYRHFDLELNNPPLADRETEKLTKDNSGGARLYGQYSFRNPQLTLLCSAGRYQEGQLIAPVMYQGSSLYGGFRLEEWLDRLDCSYSYGLKTVHPAGAYPEKQTVAALTCRFTALWSLDLAFFDKRNRIPGSDPYDQWDLTAQVSRSRWGAVYVTHQYDSLVGTTANPFASHGSTNAGVRFTLKNGSYVDLSCGRIRGGEVCAGGQCVILPASQGWKVLTHFRL